jgi:hypothetical protein
VSHHQELPVLYGQKASSGKLLIYLLNGSWPYSQWPFGEVKQMDQSQLGAPHGACLLGPKTITTLKKKRKTQNEKVTNS